MWIWEFIGRVVGSSRPTQKQPAVLSNSRQNTHEDEREIECEVVS